MSKSLAFQVNGYQVNVGYLKKRFPSQSYTQTFLTISVTQEGKKDILYEVELDDNYVLSNFNNLSLFYSYLSRNVGKNILQYNNSGDITVLVNLDQSETETEVIQLNRIQVMDLLQYESFIQKEHFYSEIFKTKIVQKIEKTVKNYYKQKTQQKEKEKRMKKVKIAELETQILLQIQNKQLSAQCNLNYLNPFTQFCVPALKISFQEFKIKILSLKSDKLYVYVQYIDAITNQQKAVRRNIQFGKAFNSSFWIDQSQIIAIAREQGQLIVKNATTNNGKIFSEDNCTQVKGLSCKITISLKQL